MHPLWCGALHWTMTLTNSGMSYIVPLPSVPDLQQNLCFPTHINTQLYILHLHSTMFYNLHCKLFILYTNVSFSFCFRLPITSCSVSFIHSKICIEWLLFWAICHLLKIQCWTRQTRWRSYLNGAHISDLGDSQQAHMGLRYEKCHEWRDGAWLGKAWPEKPLWVGDLGSDLSDEEEPVLCRLGEVIFKKRDKCKELRTL